MCFRKAVNFVVVFFHLSVVDMQRVDDVDEEIRLANCFMAIAGFLLRHQWKGCDVILDKVVEWLLANGIDDIGSMNGAHESDFADFCMWNADVQDCLRNCFAAATGPSVPSAPAAVVRVKRRRTGAIARDVVDATAQVVSLFDVPSDVLDVRGCGPDAALRKLELVVPKDSIGRCDWLAKARIAAILGSCPKPHESFKSGVRNWIEFVRITTRNTGTPFPPDFDLVIAWSHTFRCLGTFCNYLGYLHRACCAIGVSGPPVMHPALIRAKNAIVKRMVFTSR